jgi:hypothetical protein
MKKCVRFVGLLFLSITLLAATPLRAEAPTNSNPIVIIIKQIIIKVIKAMDLAIQRIQNRTIMLQNAQKVIENKMSELKLKEIGDWVGKQFKQYKEYYDELWKVKSVISYYHNIKAIMQRQLQIVEEYRRSFALFQRDKHFSKEEIGYIYAVYSGILNESVKNLDQILLVINSLSTQMTDGKRLEIIRQAAAEIDTNLSDLRQFNAQNIAISLQRAKTENDVEVIKKLYGLDTPNP